MDEKLKHDILMDYRLYAMTPDYREDCYWHSVDHDMGASVHCCGKRNVYGDCPCSDKCEYYMSRADVRKMVEEHQARNG